MTTINDKIIALCESDPIVEECLDWEINRDYFDKMTEREYFASCNRNKKAQGNGHVVEYVVGRIIEECYGHPILESNKLMKVYGNRSIKPDHEIEISFIEVKSGSHNTSGTAHEKLLKPISKYGKLNAQYGKKTYVILAGRASWDKDGQELLSPHFQVDKDLIEIAATHGVYYISFFDLVVDSENIRDKYFSSESAGVL